MKKNWRWYHFIASLCCFGGAGISCSEKLDFSSQINGEIPAPISSTLLYLSTEGRYGWHIVYKLENQQDQPVSLGRFDVAPDWSWDKQNIVYVRGALGSSNLQIWKMKYNGNDKTPITPIEIDCQDPHFSPEGKQIVFNAVADTVNLRRHIFIANDDGKMWEQITNDSTFPAGREVHYAFTSWSPAGTHIVVGGAVVPTTGLGWDFIGIIDLKTKALRELTSVRHLSPWLPEWSPQGDKIAFVSGGSNGAGLDIWTVNVDGSNLKQLTNDGKSWEPDWSSDGTQIVYSKREGDEDFLHVIYIMDADGSNKKVLFQPQFLVGHPRL